MSYLRRPASGSTDGRGIKVAAASTPGTTLHTAQASATLVDVLTVYITNTDTVARRATLEWGGTTAPDDNWVVDIPAKSTVCVVPDMLIRNSLIVKCFGDAANVLVAFIEKNVES